MRVWEKAREFSCVKKILEPNVNFQLESGILGQKGKNNGTEGTLGREPKSSRPGDAWRQVL